VRTPFRPRPLARVEFYVESLLALLDFLCYLVVTLGEGFSALLSKISGHPKSNRESCSSIPHYTKLIHAEPWHVRGHRKVVLYVGLQRRPSVPRTLRVSQTEAGRAVTTRQLPHHCQGVNKGMKPQLSCTTVLVPTPAPRREYFAVPCKPLFFLALFAIMAFPLNLD